MKYFSKRFILHLCIFTLKSAPDPGKITTADVDSWEYPIPLSITLTEVKNPLVITGVITAPIPLPNINKFGGESYDFPTL